MPLSIYIAPMLGDGDPSWITRDSSEWTDATGPYRSRIMKHMQAGERHASMDQPARHIDIALIVASDATLDAIDADSTIKMAIPIRATSLDHLKTILNAPFSSYPQAWRNAAQAYLENNGFPTDWITGSHTMRNVLGMMMRNFSLAQLLNGQGLSNALAFLSENIDTTIANVPVAYRSAFNSFLQNRGVDTSWITGSTTVRQVLNFLNDKYDLLHGYAFSVNIGGEDF